MPNAPLCRLAGSTLIPLEPGEPFTLTRHLADALLAAARVGAVLFANDAGGGAWRLRLCNAPEPMSIWQVQTIEASRLAVFARLRAMLASCMAGHVLHDLRNPMNALSLHAEMLTRIADADDLLPQRSRIQSGSRSVKERLAELQIRQNAAFGLWLADPSFEEVGTTRAGSCMESVLRLAGGYFAMQEVRLELEGRELLERCQPKSPSSYLHIALLSILTRACDAARENGGAAMLNVRQQQSPTGAWQLVVELHSALSGRMAAADAEFAEPGKLIAALSLMLDGQDVSLTMDGDLLTVIISGVQQHT